MPCPPVIGDDTKMQDMQLKAPEPTGPMFAYATAVGKKQTHASFYVNDAEEVADLLVMLSEEERPTGGVARWEQRSSEDLFS